MNSCVSFRKWTESTKFAVVAEAAIRARNPTPSLEPSEEKAMNPTPFSRMQEVPVEPLESGSVVEICVDF